MIQFRKTITGPLLSGGQTLTLHINQRKPSLVMFFILICEFLSSDKHTIILFYVYSYRILGFLWIHEWRHLFVLQNLEFSILCVLVFLETPEVTIFGGEGGVAWLCSSTCNQAPIGRYRMSLTPQPGPQHTHGTLWPSCSSPEQHVDSR